MNSGQIESARKQGRLVLDTVQSILNTNAYQAYINSPEYVLYQWMFDSNVRFGMGTNNMDSCIYDRILLLERARGYCVAMMCAYAPDLFEVLKWDDTGYLLVSHLDKNPNVFEHRPVAKEFYIEYLTIDLVRDNLLFSQQTLPE